jgi:hypothetical protein
MRGRLVLLGRAPANRKHKKVVFTCSLRNIPSHNTGSRFLWKLLCDNYRKPIIDISELKKVP